MGNWIATNLALVQLLQVDLSEFSHVRSISGAVPEAVSKVHTHLYRVHHGISFVPVFVDTAFKQHLLATCMAKVFSHATVRTADFNRQLNSKSRILIGRAS